MNLVSRMVNVVPPIQAMTASSSRLLAEPGGPTSRTCSWATRAVRTRSISSSRSIRAADSSLAGGGELLLDGRGAVFGPVDLHGVLLGNGVRGMGRQTEQVTMCIADGAKLTAG